MINVSVFGDGFVIYKTNKRLFNIEVIWENNMPYYLSYELDPNRKKQFKDIVIKSGKKLISEAMYIKTSYGYFHNIMDDNQNFYNLSKVASNIDFIAVASDGLSSFVNQNTNEQIDSRIIIEQMFSFKNITGEFLKRRVYRALKDFEKENIVPMDDVSVAIILNEERYGNL